jgi:hypothetical protein
VKAITMMMSTTARTWTTSSTSTYPLRKSPDP